MILVLLSSPEDQW